MAHRLQSTYLTYIHNAAPQGPPNSLPRPHHNPLSSSLHPLPPAAAASALPLPPVLPTASSIFFTAVLLQSQSWFHNDVCQGAARMHHSWCGTTQALAGTHVATGPTTQESRNGNKVWINKPASWCFSDKPVSHAAYQIPGRSNKWLQGWLLVPSPLLLLSRPIWLTESFASCLHESRIRFWRAERVPASLSHDVTFL